MQQVVTHNTSIQNDHSEVLLLTALVQIPDKLGEYQLCRALIDSGSQSSFISEPCVQRLRLQRSKACLPIQGIGNARSAITQGKVSLQVISRVGNHSLSLNAFVIPRITGPLPITRLENQNWKHLNNLNLADPTYCVPKDIDLLLGADVFAELFLEGKLTGINGAPSAQNTIFGWVVSGRVSASNTSGTCTLGIVSNLVRDADMDFQKMRESEEITETKSYTQEEQDCEAHFEKGTPDKEREVNGSIDGPDVQKKNKKTEEDNRPRGFDMGLEPERIIDATDSSGELMSLIKWKDSEEANMETKPTESLISTCIQDEDLLSRVSTLTKLKKVTAYCMRFIHNLRVPINQRNLGPLSSNELQSALIHWIKVVQKANFHEAINSLRVGSQLPRDLHLTQLSPFIDSSGVLKVGGRLRNAQIGYNAKHPILLPKKHRLTTLIIDDEHIRSLHAGAQLVTAALQQRFWIIQGRASIRKRIHQCITCYRLRAQPINQLMSDLPSNRVEPARPFLHCGVDYGGPIYIKWPTGRGRKQQKAYICLFVCLSTKAIHLELVGDLTTEAFINAFRRLIARRGRCTDMYSDNGTNFVGANKELKDLHKVILSHSRSDEMRATLTKEGINWHFIPPGAPHFGGLWEIGIKSVKYHLRRIMGNNVLTYEELYTLLTQIEACLNSRPLTSISNDPNDLSALTPAHFLIGDTLTSIPDPDLSHLKINRLSRWQLTQQMSQHFWKRWQTEYLSRLQQRSKWTTNRSNIAIGELVLLKEDNLPRLKWKLARVTQIHPGSDGQVRVVTVKTSDTILKRPVTKICPLPCTD